ncbi:MAG: hypothetical protein JEZ11_12300 [Desulfobacterales bacterium]|nr:hypothetical protein [Desulfobacterales bacterium]
MEWIPLDVPRPEDAKHYDIRLKTGETVSDVTYWDFGGGFSPLELDESPVIEGCPVKYPLSIVAAYRPAAGRIGTDGIC